MSRIRLCVLADALCDPHPRGLARYTRGLCTALLESGEVDLELVTQVDPAGVPLPPGRRSRLTAGREIVREQLELPRLLARHRADFEANVSATSITRSGVVGTRGQWRVVEYPTSASAANSYAKECSRFVSEGFSDYRE